MRSFLLILFMFVFLMASAQEVVSFPTYDAFEKAIIKNDEKVYVLNFWATWCAPCVKELPYFEKLYRENKNVKVILVSLDSQKDLERKLIPFIKKKNITADVILLSDKDYNSWLNKINKDWSGSIPATFIFSGNQKLFAEREFESYTELSDYVNTFTNQDN